MGNLHLLLQEVTNETCNGECYSCENSLCPKWDEQDKELRFLLEETNEKEIKGYDDLLRARLTKEGYEAHRREISEDRQAIYPKSVLN